MNRLGLSLSAAAALLMTGAVALADPPPQGGGMMGGMHGGGMMGHGMFTQEERLMLFADAQKATAGMTDDQRHAWRQSQREHFMSMSDADRAKMKADLDARWAKLTPQQQADIKTKAEAWRASHSWTQGGGGQN